ncbi:transposase [Streptomyces sp. NPDC055109]
MPAELVPDDLWERVAPLLPARPPRRPRYPGRLPADDRAVLRGIVYVLCKSVSWRDVPAEQVGCSGVTAWRRLRDWTEAGVWPQLHEVLLWELFRRVVPETVVVRPQGGGRRRAGDRACLTAIVSVATSGCSWRQLPPVFGPAWPTVYRRFARWTQQRVWARLHRVILDELGAQGGLDWSRCAVDSVSVRALTGGS